MVSKVNVGNLRYNGKTAETDTEKAELLNLFFSNVYTDENLANMPDVVDTATVYNICELRVTPQCSRKII